MFGDLPEFRGGKMEANAHLIAAAPEMYDALKALVALYDGDNPFAWEHVAEFEAGCTALEIAEGKQASNG
jgi:hypothetical protein